MNHSTYTWENIRLNKIMEMLDLELVGRFLARWVNSDTLKEWKKENFEPIVGLFPRSLTLVKGRVVWIFKFMGEVNKILHNQWKWGAQPLFLKEWKPDFDARKNRLDLLRAKEKFMSLPPVLWL
jgi:hypothetical protein